MLDYLPQFSNMRTNQLFVLRKKLSKLTLIFVMLSSLITINLSNTAYADGTTWTLRNVAANNWKSVTFGEGLFVAVSDSGASHRVMTSPDGNTWTLRELPTSAASQSWRSVAYGVVNGTGIFVAVSESGTGNRVMTSPDGITWTSRTSAADNDWQSVAFGNNVFVAVARTGTGNRVMTSTNGITWATKPSASDGDWRSVTYGNNTWVAVGRNNPVVMTSSDNGETWTSRTSPVFTFMGVTYGNNKFVAVSDQARAITSSDGITWAESATVPSGAYQSVTYGNNLFVAVSDSQNARVATSSDGNTWTSRNFGADHNWKGVTWANGVYVAVADHGTNRVMTSGTFLLVPAFTLSLSTETRTVNTAATGFTINSTGGAIASFAISATPPGMSFNTTTGALSGTPNTVADATAYTITATNATGSDTQTFSLTVTRLATKLSISRASVGNTTGVAFTTQPQITIQDADSNTVTTSSQTVTATISTGGALVGTKTAVASSGVATFTNLGIRGWGSTAYTITYSVTGLTSATQSITTASAYSIGSTGPGGGVIYYRSSSGWTCGPTLDEKCYYLEVAPPALGLASWDTDTVNSVSRAWAQSPHQTTAVPDFGDRTNAQLIGYGYRNTQLIINQGNSDSTTSAAALAQSFTGGGFSDWFLPTRNELNELCKWQTASDCNQTTTNQNSAAGATGFVRGPYWSSSELSATEAYSRENRQGGNQAGGVKSSTALVRPIRAF
jgi:hypothetical protein